jgi:hypothetical protein
MTALLDDLDQDARAWLRRRGKFSSTWDEPSLRAFLQQRSAALVPPVVALERGLHALRPAEAPVSADVLELPGRSFGARRAGVVMPRAPGDDRLLAWIGKSSRGEAFALDEAGRLYGDRRGRRERGFLALADSAASYLGRVALLGLAGDEGRLHLIFPDRAAAVAIAERLRASAISWATDSLQRWWRGGGVLVHEGDVDAPGAEATHVLVDRDHVAALLSVCRALSLRGAMSRPAPLDPHPPGPEDADEAPPEVVEEPPSTHVPHRDPFWSGDGWIALVPEDGAHAVEQVVTVGRRRVAEARWPSAAARVYARAEVAGLSERGDARLHRLGFRRDLRLTCSADELEALTSRHRLPSFAAVRRFESSLGGLRWPYGGDGAWAVLGTHATLVRDEELGGVFWDEDTEDDVVQGREDWPRVRVRDQPVVPAGIHGSTMIYLDEAGSVVALDRDTDEVTTVPRAPVPYLEGLLLHLERRRLATERRSFALSTRAVVGSALAEALGLEAAVHATDAVEAWWEDVSGETLIVQDGAGAGLLLTTTTSAILDAAAACLGRLGIAFTERR